MRQADQDMITLLTAAATALRSPPESRDMTAFRAAYERVRPGDPNWQQAFDNAAKTVLQEQRELNAQGAALAAIAGDTQERNRHAENGRQASIILEQQFGVANAQRSFLADVEVKIKEEGERRGMNTQQIQQVQQDMLMAALQLHFDPSAVSGAAVDAGIQFDPPTRQISNPLDQDELAQNVLDMIRFTAMIQSGENIRRINDLTNQITGERDPRARRQLEDERNERSRELTRMMGAEEGVRNRKGEGEVAIGETAALSVVNAHMDLINKLHSGQLDQVVLSRRPPQAVG